MDPRSGGPSYHLRKVVPQQLKSGHEVTLVTTDAQRSPLVEDFKKQLLRDPALRDAEVLVGHGLGNRWPFFRFSYSPECARWLKGRLADPRKRPDIVHIHGLFSHVTHTAATLADKNGVKYIVRPTGALDEPCFRMRSRMIKEIFCRLFLDRQLSRASVIDTTSTLEANYVRKRLPSARISVTPQGADPFTDDPGPAIAKFMDKFPQLENKQILLYLGRITKKKRLEVLVETLALLRSDFPNLFLVVAGNDDGHQALVEARIREHALTDRVVFTGFLSGLLKHGALLRSDIFTLPSLDENFSVSVIEAMAHGLPAIVSPGIGSHTHLDESEGGLTTKGEPPEIAKAVRAIFSRGKAEWGTNGQRYVARQLTYPIVVRRIETMYQKALEGSSVGNAENP